MPAKDLGTKHTCFKCGTKFYDLKKPEPLCPKCGADQRESPALKAPARGAAPAGGAEPVRSSAPWTTRPRTRRSRTEVEDDEGDEADDEEDEP